jgi:hypothetical protein
MEKVELKPIAEEPKGYHTTFIQKGVVGEASKILEEVHELIDAEGQGCKIMALVELSDIYGAMKLYLEKKHPGMTMKDLGSMSDITQRAFISGARK